MCYRPLHLRNPKFDFDKRVDKEFIDVPCGKCCQCRNRAVNDLVIRCNDERIYCESKGGGMLFLTLTYNNKSIPTIDGQYGFSLKDIQNFKKRVAIHISRRLGIEYNKDRYIKFFCVCEYGGITHRPHYHLLVFWSFPLADWKIKYIIHQDWKFGFISFGSHGGKVLNSFAATKYVCKYIRKDAQSIDDENKLPVSIRPFSPLISNGIGFHVYKDLSENDILDLFRKGSVTLLDAAGNPKVFPIPTYYRRKLLYDVSRIYSVDSSQFADTEQLDGVNRFYYDVQSMQLQEFSQEYKDFISSAKLYDIKTNFRLIPKKIYYNVRYEEYLNAVKYTRDALINILSNFKNIITDDKISQIAAVTHRNYPAAHVLFQSLQAEFRCDNFTRASEYIGFYRCRFIPYTLLAHDNNFHAATVHASDYSENELQFVGINYTLEYCYHALYLYNYFVGMIAETDYQSYKNLVYHLKYYDNDYSF